MKSNNRKYLSTHLIVVIALLSSLVVPNKGLAETITFEEVGEITSGYVYTTQIGDMVFQNNIGGTGNPPGIGIINASNLFSAELNLTHSPSNAAALSPTVRYSMQLVNGGLFDLEYAYFGVTHPNGNNGFTVEAWRGSSLVFSRNIGDIGQSATLISFGWSEVDKVIFGANMFSTGFNVVDDLTYSVASVPIPAAFWLFGSGLIGMLGFMRRRKS